MLGFSHTGSHIFKTLMPCSCKPFPGFPGIKFLGSPIHQRITSQGATVRSPNAGISLSIPEQAIEEDVELCIRPCFTGRFVLPDGYKAASPTYLIELSRNVKIQRDVTLYIHHYAKLDSEDDCKDMMFLSANPIPQDKQKPVYVFKEMKHFKGFFKLNSQIGEISTRHFCFMCTGKRRNHEGITITCYPPFMPLFNASYTVCW